MRSHRLLPVLPLAAASRWALEDTRFVNVSSRSSHSQNTCITIVRHRHSTRMSISFEESVLRTTTQITCVQERSAAIGILRVHDHDPVISSSYGLAYGSCQYHVHFLLYVLESGRYIRNLKRHAKANHCSQSMATLTRPTLVKNNSTPGVGERGRRGLPLRRKGVSGATQNRSSSNEHGNAFQRFQRST